MGAGQLTGRRTAAARWAVNSLRIFVSSPNDVARERRALEEVVQQLNESEPGVRLELFRWEADVVPRIGPPPQTVVDDQTPAYDIYLGIMASRFGSPTSRHGSGTEQEFRDAFRRWGRAGRPWILFYFKEKPSVGSSPAAAGQWQKVCKFRDELKRLGITASYSTVPEFRASVERNLRRLTRMLPGSNRKATLLLTSTSPRRKALLAQIGLLEDRDFKTVQVPFALPEPAGPLTLKDAQEQARKAAHAKIHHAIRERHALVTHGLNAADTLVVGADTLVFCEDHILDRPLLNALEFATPRDIQHAIVTATSMLKAQRGKTIHIITALEIALADDLDAARSHCAVTAARMKDFSDAEVESYVRTREPFDKAGAFGIQERGVALFEGIRGSYSNVVGLPLVEFLALLDDPLFAERILPRGLPQAAVRAPAEQPAHRLAVVSVGDINFDFVYDELPEGYFSSLAPPGGKVQGEVFRGAGGTAVRFALGAQRAGFADCAVVGVVGGDALGAAIESELHQLGIRFLLPRDIVQKTGVALVLRDSGRRDTSFTLTDARQRLPPALAERVKPDIEKADVFYVSGYCLADPNRRNAAAGMIRTAGRAGSLVVLDVVVGMHRALPFAELSNLLHDPATGRSHVDVLVSELPEIAAWFELEMPAEDDPELGRRLRESVVDLLRPEFPTLFLRTPSYTRELIASPGGVELSDLDYPRLDRRDRLGYGDALTARHLFDYLSPRVLLASRSPQRLELLRQILPASKIVVRPSGIDERYAPDESAEDRVVRMAARKAERALEEGGFGPTIEIIVGADTEIVLDEGRRKTAEIVRGPRTAAEARQALKKLSGRSHRALTGLALIGADPATGERKRVTDCVATRVAFRKLSKQEIDDYVASREWEDRAGGYAIQGLGGLLVEEIEGSYSNVVGLPLERLADLLAREFERPIWHIDRVSNWRLPRPVPR